MIAHHMHLADNVTFAGTFQNGDSVARRNVSHYITSDLLS